MVHNCYRLNGRCGIKSPHSILAMLVFVSTGLLAAEREPWTKSRIVGSPEPPLPYTVEQIPNLKFDRPLDFALEPDSGQWFILQVDGKLYAVDPQDPTSKHLVHDQKVAHAGHNHSYGVEFHPQYNKNRQVFLSYTVPERDPQGTRVSRFLVTDDEQISIDPASEQIVLTWPSGGHNGACLKFGPDGMLYITAGDGTGPFPPDSANVGQDISDLRSTLMRIDVDRSEGERPYGIPEDNPFLDRSEARPEVWAFGFRNPWKISFDKKTGELWCGDVGWELWELVFRVERGGNYGWSIKEGPQAIRNDLKPGPGEIIPPVVEHPHSEAASITGGFVYYGQKYPDLVGKYIYGDYVSGKIWAIENRGNQLSSIIELADTSLAIVTFGVDAAGELIIVDYSGGLYRLAPNPVPDTSADFPKLLSETGLFRDTTSHLIDESGVESYWLNTQMWQDGSNSSYVVAIPNQDSIGWTANRMRWNYPKGTVFAKTIGLSTVVEQTLAHRRIETQILHFNGHAWQPYSYLWNDEQSDAELVAASGADKTLTVLREDKETKLEEGNQEESKLEEIRWKVHSRAECSACHVPRAGHVIGFDPANLQKNTPFLKNQMAHLSDLGIFDQVIPENQIPKAMVDLEETADLESRARSYLAINCAHCHRREGGGSANIEFLYEHPNEKTRAVDTVPTQGTFGIGNAKVIAPGDPHRSVLYYRLSTVGRGRMPHLGVNHVDEDGLQLIADWIRSLAPDSSSATQKKTEMAEICDRLLAEGDHAAVAAILASTQRSLELCEQIATLPSVTERQKIAMLIQAKAPVHLRGMFERFLPSSLRQKTLGTTVDANAILAMTGNAANGEKLFHTATGITCRNCHVINDRGKTVGPDLSKLGSQRTRGEILESILDPSRKVDAKFAQRTIVTQSGQVMTGVVISESTDGIELKDAAGNSQFFAHTDVEEIVTQPRSLMPDLLVKEMTTQELVDLLAYLASLK